MIQLDPEQDQAVKQIVAEPTKAALVGSQYGTGKTIIAVRTIRELNLKKVLIVCPLFTKYSWRKTIEEDIPNSADKIRIIDSSKSGKSALVDLVAGVDGYYIIGRELFARRANEIGKISHKLDMLVYDECQKWANRKSQGFKIMKTMKPTWKLALSATPQRNKFEGLYAITKWLWPNLVPNSFWAWAKQWAQLEYDYFAGWVVTGEKNPGAYVNQLPCYIRLEKDFGEPEIEEIYVELSPKERKIYDDFCKRLVIFLRENYLLAKVPASKRVHARQMSLGELAVDEEGNIHYPLDMKSTKYETLVEYLKDHPDEPALIFTGDSERFAKVVAERLALDGFRAAEWSGKVPEKRRHEIKEQFINGELDYIVATPASIGEGTDGLQRRSRLMVWLAQSDDNMYNEQAFRRLHRRGQERQVIAVYIIAINTYDKGIFDTKIQQTLEMNKILRKRK